MLQAVNVFFEFARPGVTFGHRADAWVFGEHRC
jgi:hypothetical protein